MKFTLAGQIEKKNFKWSLFYNILNFVTCFCDTLFVDPEYWGGGNFIPEALFFNWKIDIIDMEKFYKQEHGDKKKWDEC